MTARMSSAVLGMPFPLRMQALLRKFAEVDCMVQPGREFPRRGSEGALRRADVVHASCVPQLDKFVQLEHADLSFSHRRLFDDEGKA